MALTALNETKNLTGRPINQTKIGGAPDDSLAEQGRPGAKRGRGGRGRGGSTTGGRSKGRAKLEDTRASKI